MMASEKKISKHLSVLILTPWFPNTPGERDGNFVYDSSNALLQEGIDVSVLVVRPWLPTILKKLKPEWKQGKLNVNNFSQFEHIRQIDYFSIPRNILLPVSNWFRSHRIGLELQRMAGDSNADIIHAHTEAMAPIAVKVGEKIGIPVVVTLHGINTAPRYIKARRQRAMFCKALNAADRVIIVGEPLRRFFKEITGQDYNYRVVHNGFCFPSSQTAPRQLFSGDTVKFISVSNLHEGKGIDINLKALGKLKKNGNANWVYTIVGDGDERGNLEKLTRKLGITDQVIFKGAVPHSDVYALLAEADVFTLPSYREAFGIAYVEAMACGLLTIGVQGQGPEAFIEDGKTGILVPPKNSDSLEIIFQRVFTEKAKMPGIAMAGYIHVHEQVTWKRHAEQLMSIYQEILA